MSRCRVPLSPIKIPTWQKRQGSWPALDYCTPDSLRSSAGTWQTTFWCKEYDKSATVQYSVHGSCCFTWQLLLNLVAVASVPGGCYLTTQLLYFCQLQLYFPLVNVPGSCYCFWELQLYRPVAYGPGSCNCSFHLLDTVLYCTVYLADDTLPCRFYFTWSCYGFWELQLYLQLLNIPGSCNCTFQLLTIPGGCYFNWQLLLFLRALTVPSSC